MFYSYFEKLHYKNPQENLKGTHGELFSLVLTSHLWHSFMLQVFVVLMKKMYKYTEITHCYKYNMFILQI